ncbi:hypothetical protein C8F04DRAFT_1202261 [Mycena alexandri]|uniref:Uncharacterized protein n=1 Tax=Mycena alexandri TaxID=1745969 RepID=A0AAD6WL81_9AGAR|nr:hypothetical protein C8F04DRAFT_1202261 [Mycena alexandri]
MLNRKPKGRRPDSYCHAPAMALKHKVGVCCIRGAGRWDRSALYIILNKIAPALASVGVIFTFTVDDFARSETWGFEDTIQRANTTLNAFYAAGNGIKSVDGTVHQPGSNLWQALERASPGERCGLSDGFRRGLSAAELIPSLPS